MARDRGRSERRARSAAGRSPVEQLEVWRDWRRDTAELPPVPAEAQSTERTEPRRPRVGFVLGTALLAGALVVTGLTALGVGPVVVVLFGAALAVRQARRKLNAQREAIGRRSVLNGLLVGMISGIAKLRVAGAEQRMTARWSAGYARQQAAQRPPQPGESGEEERGPDHDPGRTQGHGKGCDDRQSHGHHHEQVEWSSRGMAGAPAHPAASGARDPLGYGVIGSPTDSGSVSLGSSPGTPARQTGGAVR